ncbi:hypothetical protein EON82_13500 [bacterium]|nr:MAG: hypothetical protein EON82_13500 [bacterium]
MNTAALLCSVVFFVHHSPAQDGEINVSLATQRYRQYRIADTEPPFSLAKVKAIIAKIKPTPGEDPSEELLVTKAWSRMTTRERFTYCMLHGEVYSQNCNAMPWVAGEEKKIFAELSGLQGETLWSDRQRAFLKQNRREVIRLLRTTMQERRRAGLNLKVAIMEMDAYPLIPDLVRLYQRERKDQDILTVLGALMKQGKYRPFVTSTVYRKLYGPDANYQSSIVASEANQKLMLDLATGYYRSRVKYATILLLEFPRRRMPS